MTDILSLVSGGVDLSAYTTTATTTALLDAKVDDVQLLTNVPIGAVFTDTVYTKPANEPISYITGLQVAIDSKEPIFTATLPLEKNGTVLSTLWKPSNLTIGSGISRTFSDTLGTSSIGLDGTESRSTLFLKDSNVVVRELTSSLAGDLMWDGSTVAIATDVTNGFDAITVELTQKEDNLNFYSESATGSTTTILQTSDDDASFPIYLSWTSGSYTNVANSHQLITTGAWHTLNSIGVGMVSMTVQLKANSVDHVVFSTNNTIDWTTAEQIKFTGLTSSWQTFAWEFTSNSTNVNLHFGVIIPGSGVVQTAGDAQLKNLHLYRNTAESTITSRLTCQEDIICSRTVVATSYTSTSDRSVKADITIADPLVCLNLLRNVDAHTYVRKDMPGTRLGFIANDIQDNIPDEFANLIGVQHGTTPLLTLDYSRLVCVLWQVVKSQEQRISALEAKKTKK